MVLKCLGTSPNIRAFVGSMFSYGVRIAALCVLPPLALQKVLGGNPWPIFFPFQRDWWKDLLFAFLPGTVALAAFFLLEVKAGWLGVEGWNWKLLPLGGTVGECKRRGWRRSNFPWVHVERFESCLGKVGGDPIEWCSLTELKEESYLHVNSAVIF